MGKGKQTLLEQGVAIKLKEIWQATQTIKQAIHRSLAKEPCN